MQILFDEQFADGLPIVELRTDQIKADIRAIDDLQVEGRQPASGSMSRLQSMFRHYGSNIFQLNIFFAFLE